MAWNVHRDMVHGAEKVRRIDRGKSEPLGDDRFGNRRCCRGNLLCRKRRLGIDLPYSIHSSAFQVASRCSAVAAACMPCTSSQTGYTLRSKKNGVHPRCSKRDWEM